MTTLIDGLGLVATYSHGDSIRHVIGAEPRRWFLMSVAWAARVRHILLCLIMVDTTAARFSHAMVASGVNQQRYWV